MRDGGAGPHRRKRDSSLVLALEKAESKMMLCKVLLVDDEPAILSVLHWAVQDLGCEVTSAHGGQAALDRLCKEPFDILITDLIMPDLDGFFLLKMAKKLDPDMKVMLMTGSPELIPHVGCALDGLLVKPFGLDELKSAILNCVQGEECKEDREEAYMNQGL